MSSSCASTLRMVADDTPRPARRASDGRRDRLAAVDVVLTSVARTPARALGESCGRHGVVSSRQLRVLRRKYNRIATAADSRPVRPRFGRPARGPGGARRRAASRRSHPGQRPAFGQDVAVDHRQHDVAGPRPRRRARYGSSPGRGAAGPGHHDDIGRESPGSTGRSRPRGRASARRRGSPSRPRRARSAYPGRGAPPAAWRPAASPRTCRAGCCTRRHRRRATP